MSTESNYAHQKFDGAGVERLVEVIAKASHGPYRLDFGTITDRNQEILTEFTTPDDAQCIYAMLTLRNEMTELAQAACKALVDGRIEPGSVLYLKAVEFMEGVSKWHDKYKPTSEVEEASAPAVDEDC